MAVINIGNECGDKSADTLREAFNKANIKFDALDFDIANIPVGKDGLTPHIDVATGNWFLGTYNTGVRAKGEKGDQGPVGPIGPAGINGSNGSDGVDGTGYDNAVIDDATGHLKLDHIASDGSSTTVDIGKVVGRDGIDGKDGSGVTIQGSDTIANILLITDATTGDMWLATNDDAGASIPGVAGDGYVWNGTVWSNVGPIRGPKGADGVDGTDGTDGVDGISPTVINDLTTGGTTDALSAEMGKVLKTEVDAHVLNSDNPHSINKNQVGLGFVSDTGIGDKFLADDGTYKAGGSGSGVPDEAGHKHWSLTSPTGFTSDAAWVPFHYNPDKLDKDRTIFASDRAMVAGPFEIPDGMTLTVEADGSFIIV